MNGVSGTIDSLITHNQWGGILYILKSKKGIIYPYGGRYASGPLVEFEGYISINKLCLRVLNIVTSDPKTKAIKNECIMISNVIKELKRLYNETQAEIRKTSTLVFLATVIYDIWEMGSERVHPIERLEAFFEDSTIIRN